MITYDPIFEQNYRKKVDAALQDAFLQGRSQGVMDILKVIDHFNKNDMPVTPKTVIMFLQQMEIKQEPKITPENKCSEIPFPGEAQECVLPIPEKKKPKLEIVQ